MIVVAVAVAGILVPDAGLSPSVKPVATPVVAAVEAGARAEVVVAAPRGLSINARPPPAAVVVAAAVLAAEVGAAPKVKPVPVAVAVAVAVAAAAAAAAAVEAGAANRDRPEAAGAAWADVEGAGVNEGLIPKVNPPP